MTEQRYAIVTPYFKEERPFLERCIRSVQQQQHPVDHILVADGFAQDWIDDLPVRHIKLDRNYADYGNTPRTMGAMLAIAEGYAGIGFLDADNWLEPDHVTLCRRASKAVANVDYVMARRHMRRPDETTLKTVEDPIAEHCDTNCFFLLPGSYHIVPHFLLIPPQLAPICDRVFYRALRERKLTAVMLKKKTVNYHCLWEYAYRQAGETAPPNAKPNLDIDAVRHWLDTRTPRELQILDRLCGCTIRARQVRGGAAPSNRPAAPRPGAFKSGDPADSLTGAPHMPRDG
jgi:hypothetical protein